MNQGWGGGGAASQLIAEDNRTNALDSMRPNRTACFAMLNMCT
jgi:hypothetical protein